MSVSLQHETAAFQYETAGDSLKFSTVGKKK
jgi:hypothetical protein